MDIWENVFIFVVNTVPAGARTSAGTVMTYLKFCKCLRQGRWRVNKEWYHI